MHKRLLQVGLLKAATINPDLETTYFNVAGERSQTYMNGNVHSRFYKIVSQLKNKADLEGTQYSYLLHDAFSQGSVIMKKLFSDKGSPITQSVDSEPLLTVGHVGGTINESKGRSKSSSKLTYKERLVQELNLNLEGWYLNLVPGDSSTEWMTYMGNHITQKQLLRGMEPVFSIFRDYFISEINLSRDNRNVSPERNNKDLRFFKGVLKDSLHKKILRNTKALPENIYDSYKDEIEAALTKYIKEKVDTLNAGLKKYNILDETLGSIKLNDVNAASMSASEYKTFLEELTVNYMIANIEMHKLIYADPYQYKDELKRTKSFNSPRQEILNSSSEVNALMNRVWNKNFDKDSFGWTDFIRDHFKTVTLSDVEVINEFKAYNVFKETDGGGMITFKAYRNFRLRASDWTEDNERQYRYDMAYEAYYKNGGKLSLIEATIFNAGNPKVKSTYTSLKPVVTGNRNNSQKFNDTVLDKYALFPLSYRIAREMKATNSIKLYNSLQKQDIDYVVFNSGRKVGAHTQYAPYTKEGAVNETPFEKEEIINIPFSIIGQQVEIPSKDSNDVTRGSQVTKMVTMDKMDAGIPIDFNQSDSFVSRFKQWNSLSEEEKLDNSPLYKEIVNNKRLLRALTENGFNIILDKLGIVKTSKGFDFGEDGISKLITTLKEEVLNRSANDNVIAALNSFLEETSVLEATPAYYQISNILYSIVDKQLIHTKISGGQKVQLPSTFLKYSDNLSISKSDPTLGTIAAGTTTLSPNSSGKNFLILKASIEFIFCVGILKANPSRIFCPSGVVFKNVNKSSSDIEDLNHLPAKISITLICLFFPVSLSTTPSE
jgi:hypothetical protein